jgi:GT2 family glycosyltransferase
MSQRPIEPPDAVCASLPMSPVRVAVIVVNFNSGQLLTECVRSVLASTVPVKVIVSDNGSEDESLGLLKTTFGSDAPLHIVENCTNLGFARASNRALGQTSEEFLLFLNPDCVVRTDTLAKMIAVMGMHPEAGMAGCLVRNPDGTEQAGCRRTIPTPWRGFVRTVGLSRLFPQAPRFQSFILSNRPLPKEPIEVEAISGAFMWVRRTAMEQVGPLDPGYFLHCEDLDWCMRFREAGWRILFVPHAEVTHTKGVCSEGRPVRVLWHMHRGMVRFYRKFFRKAYPLPLMGIVLLGIWTRFALLATLTWVRRVRRNKRV